MSWSIDPDVAAVSAPGVGAGTGSDAGAGANGDDAPSRERILRSARAAVEQTGVLGLRVGQVAGDAGTSLTLIYKYFESRDGLLAQVLGDLYEEFIDDDLDRAVSYLEGLGDRPASAREIVELIPMPGDPGREAQRWLRVQILAASKEIPALRRRLEQSQARIDGRLRDLLADAERRLGRDLGIPVKALALLVQAMPLGYVFNDLLTEDRVTASEVHDVFLRLFAR